LSDLGLQQLVYLPLGGSNEIGMNLNLYGFGDKKNRKWIIVDCGVTFASEEHIPGVDIILPDPEFISNIKDDILGIIITHAHEDHIGALGYLWPLIGAPIYATAFTAELIKDKLRERGIFDKVKLNIVPLKGKVSLEPFEIEYVTITHSIAEPNGIKITTPLGAIFHTGDWKIDPNPQIGAPTDIDAITKMGDEGVLAMVCDSTNVFQEGESGSEEGVRIELAKLVKQKTGKIAIACFASNVARVASAIDAAQQSGRAVCLMGRSMVRIATAARNTGIIPPFAFVEPDKAKQYDDDKILFLCTGSQGEPRAALARIAEGTHPHLSLGAGDSVLFSSREIPGNERDIYDLINKLLLAGVDVVTAHDAPIHVSGHPCRDELAQMYAWVRPQMAIPTHGERRHIIEHSRFAKSIQIPKSIAPRNGDMVELAPNGPRIIDEVPVGRVYVDGNILLESGSEIMKERRKIGENGYILLAATLNNRGEIIAGPDLRTRGISSSDEDKFEKILDRMAIAAENAIKKLKPAERLDEEYCEDVVMKIVKKLAYLEFNKRPMIEVIIMSI
jgi:ribonuclease J